MKRAAPEIRQRGVSDRHFTCGECGRSFVRASQLQRHHSTHIQEKLHKCRCGKIFSYHCDLVIHQRKHTGERPYACTQCHKRFAVRSILVNHERIHSGEKPYCCPRCDRRFAQPAGVNIHLKNHHSEYREKPFACQFCEKAFAVEYSLHCHMKIHNVSKQDAVGDENDISSQADQRNMSLGLMMTAQFAGSSGREEQHVCADAHCSHIIVSDISLENLGKLVELDYKDLPSFQVGYYGTSLVTLTFLPHTAAIDILSSSQPCIHPNIATLFGVTLMAGSCSILVMEKVDRSLSQLLDGSGDQLSFRERLDIAVGCVSVIDYLHHQLGISHGMLSRDYIFCSNSFSVKVLDPMTVVLLEGKTSLASVTMEDDTRQLGHVLLALFSDVFRSHSDLCDNPAQPSQLLRLQCVLRQMVDENEILVSGAEDVRSVLEEMRQSDQYRQCPPKRSTIPRNNYLDI